MADASGFAGGMQDGMQLGLGMFNAMQNASYQQQLMQNADENQQMRRQQIQLQQQEYLAGQRQKAVLQDQFVLEHPDAFSRDTRLDVMNRSNMRLAGPNARPITGLAVDAFEADLRGLPDKLKNTNTREEGLSIMAEMEAKSRENPLFAKAWDVRKPVLQQVMEQKGLYDTVQSTFGQLLSPQETKRWVEKADPNMIRKTMEDGDLRKMFIINHVEQNMSAWHTGEKQMSDSAIRENLAMARSVGMPLGETGAKILEKHDTYTQYNESAESLTMAKGRLDPLYKAVASSPSAKELKDSKVELNAEYFAHPTPESPFGSLKYVKQDVATAEKRTADFESFMGKNPQIAEAMKQLAPEAMDRTRQATDQLNDLKRQRVLLEKDKMHPNREMYLNLIDRQVESVTREMKAWQPLSDYNQDPNIVNLQKVLRSEDTLKRSLNEVSQLRDTALTASDRIAKQEVNQKQAHVAEVQATGYAQMKLNQFAAENPNADENTLRGQSAAFAKEAQSKYGQLPDSNKVLDSFITKRTQSTILDGTERKTVSEAEANVAVADTLLKDYKPEYFGAADNFMNNLKAKLPEGAPGFMKLSNDAQEYRQRLELFRTQYRKRIFGSSLTEGEKESAMSSMVNLEMGDDQAKATLQEMKNWEQKAIESTKRNAQRSEQVKQGVDPYQKKNAAPAFDDFKSFYQQNKGKFASPEEAAAAFFKGQ